MQEAPSNTQTRTAEKLNTTNPGRTRRWAPAAGIGVLAAALYQGYTGHTIMAIAGMAAGAVLVLAEVASSDKALRVLQKVWVQISTFGCILLSILSILTLLIAPIVTMLLEHVAVNGWSLAMLALYYAALFAYRVPQRLDKWASTVQETGWEKLKKLS